MIEIILTSLSLGCQLPPIPGVLPRIRLFGLYQRRTGKFAKFTRPLFFRIFCRRCVNHDAGIGRYYRRIGDFHWTGIVDHYSHLVFTDFNPLVFLCYLISIPLIFLKLMYPS